MILLLCVVTLALREMGRQFARIDANNDEKLSWDEMMAAAGITDA